mgnify:CR=1 FL=1
MEDVIIIGAGITGCAVAYDLSFYDLKVRVLEKCNDVSCGTTKANSAIIHAGYDPREGTEMARLNVLGSQRTKEICEKLDVPYQQCGALVLAFDEKDEEHIHKLYQRGLNNGVEKLQILNGDEVKECEPYVSDQVKGALYAPTSAIISPWELCLALAETAVRNGVSFNFNEAVTDIRKDGEVFTVVSEKGSYEAKTVINCAGLYADKINDMVNPHFFSIHSVKGEYYLLDKGEHVRAEHTIFQCPNEKGKGVLVSPTVHGNLIVGPDASDNEREDLSTTASGLAFVKEQAVRSVPSVNFRENIRNFAGNRAKTDFSDFILGENETKGFYNVAGICSPGLSSALAISLDVVMWLKEKMELRKKENTVDHRKVVRFKQLSEEEKNELIQKRPDYGRIICRCETISEGEIVDAIHSAIPAVSLDSVKRHCNSSMGRCQGSFCGPKITEILARELQISPLDVLQDQPHSNILVSETKEVL